MDNHTGPDTQAAVGGALVVGLLAGASGGGGLALVAGLTGVAGLVTFLGSVMVLTSLAVLLTIIDGMRRQEAISNPADGGEHWDGAGRDGR